MNNQTKSDSKIGRLTEEIKAHYAAYMRNRKAAFDSGIALGRALVAVRPLIDEEDTGWTRYIEKTCGMRYRTAHRWHYVVLHEEHWPTSAKLAELECDDHIDFGVVGLEKYISEALNAQKLLASGPTEARRTATAQFKRTLPSAVTSRTREKATKHWQDTMCVLRELRKPDAEALMATFEADMVELRASWTH